MDVFTVQFENNGHGIEPADQIVPSGGLVTDPGSLTETGYTFGGWYEDAALTKVWDFAKHTVTANTTIYAKWAPHTYTVRFYSNGGSGAMEDEGFTYGV